MSRSTCLVLWRHGVTDWNERGVFQGQTDIPLNQRGLAQASAAAPRLAAFAPAAIVSSPMLRAQQTAGALADLVGRPIEVDDRMAEIDVGTWTGRTMAEVSAEDPAILAAIRSGRDYRRSPTGETMTEVGARAGACLLDVAQAHPGSVSVIVSHSGAIRMGIANLLGWTHDTAVALGGMSNCAWAVLVKRYDVWRIETYNCALPSQTATAGSI